MPNITDFTLSSGQVAERFGVTDETIRRWADAGKLRHVRLPSGQLRFAEADLDAALTPIEPTAGGRWDSEGTYLEREA